jgi:hypothetical protein
VKKFVIALITCIVVHTGAAFAVCKTEACKRAVAWKSGYTAIVLNDDISRDDYFGVLAAVKANDGVVAIEAERVLLGWLPVTASGKVRATRGVRDVLYDRAARPESLVSRPEALAALSFFNRVVAGEYEDTIEAGLAAPGEPLINCGILRPKYSTEGQAAGVASEGSAAIYTRRELGTPRGALPEYNYHTPYQNPDMRGRVTVQLFRLDSDGTIDPNVYTWPSADYGYAGDQVYGAFTFWVNQASSRGVTVSFRVVNKDPFSRYTRSYVPTPTHYEPIRHPLTDDYLWVNDAMTRQGYAASPVTWDNVLTQNEAFNRDQKADPTYGPFDRSFSIYLIYNPPPAPAYFTNGQNAFAYYDGPFATVLWNSANWGASNLSRVVSHETGHIFWACDEYSGGCSTCNTCLIGGPRTYVSNGNCDSGRGIGPCDVQLTACMMKYDDYVLCPHTPLQVGW